VYREPFCSHATVALPRGDAGIIIVSTGRNSENSAPWYIY
jgi:hypothetical protein